MKLQQTLYAAIDKEGNVASRPDGGHLIAHNKVGLKNKLDFWKTIDKDYYNKFKIAPVKLIHS